jgi:hypothetical protein
MKKLLIEMVGWYGTIAIVGAYALNSFSVIQANTLLYQLLNMTGAIGIVIVSFSKKAYQPGVLNSIWTIIAAVAIIKMFMGM